MSDWQAIEKHDHRNRFTRFVLLLLVCCAGAITLRAQHASRQLLDEDWRFFRGSALGAEKQDFKPENWRTVNLPHDWSIEDIPHTQSPFSIGAAGQVNGGFTEGGTGWYRKQFMVPGKYRGKQFLLQFDGVYMNADVYLNGKKLGTHPYGYTSFYFDLTERLKWDTLNTIAVRVHNEGENSRWYAGSGIYRHVWLTIADRVHVKPWGVFAFTRQANTQQAVLGVAATVENTTGNRAAVSLTHQLMDPAGRVVASATVQQNIDSNYTFTQQLTVPQPQLWSPRNPVLYRLMTTVSVNGQVTDTFYTVTGIRTVTIDSRNGLQVNGESLKLKGGCIHHDHGPLGAASYDRAEERKVEILRAAGYNAIRLSHNPPAPALLDACDRLGMLVIDEAFDCWEEKKNTSDYHLYFKEWWQRDLESMVLRDRNHPSVILWSTGNEIPNRDKPAVVAVSRKLSDYLHQLDPTRPVTCGVNGIGPDKDPFLATLDVAGYNYARDKYAADHDRLPERVMYGSESFPIESYDYWMAVEKYPSVIGDFVWTAWDYIGEASIGWLGYPQRQYFYPWNLAYCGDIDICGWKRPQSFYRDALWKDTALSLFVQSPVPSFDTAAYKEPWSNWHWLDVWPSWNWKGFEGRPLQVQAFTSCDSVQLYLNNRFIGTQRTTRQDRYKATFSVPYTPGTLKAVGYLGGRAVKTALLQTAGTPAAIRAVADRQEMHADGQDLSYITIEITDAQGRPVPVAANELQFTVSGPAKITGVGNADPRSTESCQASHRKAWKGRCLVILQSSKKAGPVQLTIRAAGLKTTSLQLRVK